MGLETQTENGTQTGTPKLEQKLGHQNWDSENGTRNWDSKTETRNWDSKGK